MLTEQQTKMIRFYRSKKESHKRIAVRLNVDVALVAEFSRSIPRKPLVQVQPNRAEDPTPEEIKLRCAEVRAGYWKFGKNVKTI